MTHCRNQTNPLSGETAELQRDDAWETEKDHEVAETLKEELLRLRGECRQRVDRMIQPAAETPIVLRPGLSESEAYDFFIARTGDADDGFVPERALQL